MCEIKIIYQFCIHFFMFMHMRVFLSVSLPVRLSAFPFRCTHLVLRLSLLNWIRFLSPILSEVIWQVTWPRLLSQVTCGVFGLWFLIWLHRLLGPKSLGLFWNAPYCFPSDALLTSHASVSTLLWRHTSTIYWRDWMQHHSNPRTNESPTMLLEPVASIT